jgi:hypothetical protein
MQKNMHFRRFTFYFLLFHRGRVRLPITVARSNTGIVGSNPTQGMDVCVRLFCVCVVLCVGSDLVTG